jgi:hypothetical protein
MTCDGLATSWITMNRSVRHCTLGTFAGLVSSAALAVALGDDLLGVALGTAVIPLLPFKKESSSDGPS